MIGFHRKSSLKPMPAKMNISRKLVLNNTAARKVGSSMPQTIKAPARHLIHASHGGFFLPKVNTSMNKGLILIKPNERLRSTIRNSMDHHQQAIKMNPQHSLDVEYLNQQNQNYFY